MAERALGSQYVLEDVLGRGATGEVWRGRSKDGGAFAFKILFESLARDPETVRRFLQEKDILTQFAHPNLVRVHDMVAEGETLAIVMDLVEGHDLRRLLTDRQVLPPGEACALAAQAAAGLAVIHAANVVHRDVKPENVLLDTRSDPPNVRLTDFGIARIAQPAGSKSTLLVGTPPYVAPELARGQEPTPATDLYSLGIMLYEMCCGVSPFADPSTYLVLKRHVENQAGRPEGIPDPLWALISDLLAKEPHARPGPADQVAVFLEALAGDLRQVPPAPLLTQPPESTPVVHGAQTSIPLQPGPDGQPAKQEPAAGKKRSRRGLAVTAVGSLLVLAIVGTAGYVALRPAGHTEPHRPVSSAALPTGAASEPVESSPPAPSYGPNEVPDLRGLTEADARAKLPGTVAVQLVRQQAPPGTPDGVVLDQDPQPGADLPKTLELTIASAQATQYLADLTPTAGEFTSNVDAANLKLSGHAQLHALGDDGSPCGDETGDAEFDIGQHYRRLTGLAGLDDNSPYAKTQVTLEIFGDQRKLKSITVGLGHPKDMDIDISGVLRLGFRWTFTNGDASLCHGGTLVLGDAQLVAAAGYVPPPSADPSSSP